MDSPTLDYVFDPFCGWCYGAAPLLDVLRETEGLAITLHAGGMMAGGNRQPVTAELRRFVMHHDERIAAMSGQPFGDAYRNGLLADTQAVFDSEPPTTAILAAEQLGGRGLDMVKRLQQAHFVEGRRIADEAVLGTLAAELGIDASAFTQAFAALSGAATQQHIQASRRLLREVGGQGFPTFALRRNGHAQVLEFGRFLGAPDKWRAWLGQQLGR